MVSLQEKSSNVLTMSITNAFGGKKTDLGIFPGSGWGPRGHSGSSPRGEDKGTLPFGPEGVIGLRIAWLKEPLHPSKASGSLRTSGPGMSRRYRGGGLGYSLVTADTFTQSCHDNGAFLLSQQKHLSCQLQTLCDAVSPSRAYPD